MSYISGLLNGLFRRNEAAVPPSTSASGTTTALGGAGSPTNPMPGLENNGGNDCWANSLMQTIATVPSLQTVVLELGKDVQAHGATADLKNQGRILVEELNKLIADRKSRTPISRANTQLVRQALSKIIPPRDGQSAISATNRQEDAFEALCCLCSQYELMRRAYGTFSSSEPGYFHLETTRHYRATGAVKDPARSSERTATERVALTRRDPHHRDAYSTLQDGNLSHRKDPERFIQMDLTSFETSFGDFLALRPDLREAERKKGEQALFNELMQSFFSSPLPADSDVGDYFDAADGRMHGFQPYKETRRFSRAPNEFILEMKRFKKTLMGREKIDAQVPLQERFTLPAAYVGGSDATYEVDSFVVHMGSIGGGHYISFQKIDGIWYEMNDSRVNIATDCRVKEALQQSYFQHYKKLPDVDAAAYAVQVLADEPPVRTSSTSTTSTPIAALRPSVSASLPVVTTAAVILATKTKEIAAKREEVVKFRLWAEKFHRGEHSFEGVPERLGNKLKETVWLRDRMPDVYPYGENQVRDDPATFLTPCGPVIYTQGANLIAQLLSKETAELELMQINLQKLQVEQFKQTFTSAGASKPALHDLFDGLDFEIKQKLILVIAQKQGKAIATKELEKRHDFGKEELDKDVLVLCKVYRNREQIDQLFAGSTFESLRPSSDEQRRALDSLIALLASGSSDKGAITRAFYSLEVDLQNNLKGLIYKEHVSRRAFEHAQALITSNIGSIATKVAGSASIIEEIFNDYDVLSQYRTAVVAERKAAHAKRVEESADFTSDQKREIRERMGLN